MAAYAALTSLLQILDQLERHPFPPISLDREQVESLTKIATFLQKFLEGYNSPFVDSDEADPLEMRIADAAYAAEDVIESYIVDNIQSSAAATHNDEVISSRGSTSAHILTRISSSPFNSVRGYNKETATRDLQKVIKKMDSIKKKVMKMMSKKSSTAVQDHHQQQRNILRSSSFTGKNSTSVMVGFDDVIGGLLAKSQHTYEHWAHIAHKLNSILNSENDDYCLKILKLSYNHLPAYLKPSFLYMGFFKEDTKIRVSTLIKLWVSEGFLEPKNGKSLETIGEGFLKDLIDRNLILVDELGKTGNIKYCKMHDLLRDLCLKEAENERFYDVKGLRSPRGIQNHKRRRIVFDRRVLYALKSTRSHVRSFIYRFNYGSVGLLLNFRLLRILKADERPDSYQLEDVIYKLVNSWYVAISNINDLESINLPSSVNFLWNLHTLRISGCTLMVAPVEIWKMSQLRHVEFKWRGNMYLPDPPSGSSIVILENLQTLTGILNFKCGEEMVKRIPNIKKLGIEYRRHDGDDYCLNNLHSLHKLESLTIKLVDENEDDFLHNITFPQFLIKLTLELEIDSEVGWEEMLEKIGGSSPLLQKLKLKWGVFKTGKWETVEGQFPSLKYLQLSSCDGLKQWMIEESSHFPCLEHLHLAGLGELEEIPLEIGEIPTLQSIQLVLCSESTVKSAKKIVEEQEELQGGEEHLPFLVRVAEWMSRRKALESLQSRNFQFEVTHYFHWLWSSFNSSSQLEQLLQDIYQTTAGKIYIKSN